MGINFTVIRLGMQKMQFSSSEIEVISVPDSELSVLGYGKEWESPLSPLGLVVCIGLSEKS